MADVIREDFDRIAALPEARWDHNSHYHAFLLRQLPAELDTALDVGCGRGAFTRLLATRARRATGIDLSSAMVRAAYERSAAVRNVDFRVADVKAIELPAMFDCVACIATLHHLPLRQSLERLAAALAPGGTLLVLDLYRAATPADFAVSALAAPVNLLARLARTGGLLTRGAVREAWARHAPNDSFPTLVEVRDLCAGLLPGARVRRHLYWRYSVVWRKGSAPSSSRPWQG